MRLTDERDFDHKEMIGVNPHRRCLCMNQNNFDGICSFCEWEEDHISEEDEELSGVDDATL